MRGRVRVQRIAVFGPLIGCVGRKQVWAVKNKSAGAALYGRQVVLSNAGYGGLISTKKLVNACVFTSVAPRARVI